MNLRTNVFGVLVTLLILGWGGVYAIDVLRQKTPAPNPNAPLIQVRTIEGRNVAVTTVCIENYKFALAMDGAGLALTQIRVDDNGRSTGLSCGQPK